MNDYKYSKCGFILSIFTMILSMFTMILYLPIYSCVNNKNLVDLYDFYSLFNN